jgi:hypothetical protein
MNLAKKWILGFDGFSHSVLESCQNPWLYGMNPIQPE